MKILVSGAGGLVGRSLVPAAKELGHDVRRLVRGEPKGEEFWWKPESGEINFQAVNGWSGPEAVVHLAGENIAQGRWTEAQKRRVRESRVDATERFCGALLRLQKTPSVLISASAIGYYGNRGDEILTEDSPPGSGFLAEVTAGWERASEGLKRAGVRVAHLRFGVILSGEGGALGRMLPLFRFGFGGRIGDGRQWISWISRTDVIRMILFVLAKSNLEGVFNAVAPVPVRNAEFTKALAESLKRPAFFCVPRPVLRLGLGEMAEELLLASQRVVPARMMKAGFQFEHPTIEKALAAEL